MLPGEDGDKSRDRSQDLEPRGRNYGDFCLFCFGQAGGFTPGRLKFIEWTPRDAEPSFLYGGAAAGEPLCNFLMARVSLVSSSAFTLNVLVSFTLNKT